MASTTGFDGMHRRRLLQHAAFGAGVYGAAQFSRPSPASAQAAAANLRIWAPGGSALVCSLQNELAADYQAMVPGASFEGGVQCVGTRDDFVQSFLAAIAAGNPPDASIIWETPVALGARGALLPLDDLMAKSTTVGLESWPAGLLAGCRYGGKTYGLPVVAGTYGMWYNQELFEAKGIPSGRDQFPKTWVELRRLSKEFTRWNGTRLETAGFMPCRFYATLPIWSALNGAEIYDAENRRYRLDDERNVEMMAFTVDWLEEEYKGDVNAIDRSGSFKIPYASPEGLPPAFQQGRQAGIEEGSWLIGDLDGEIQPVFTRWDVAPMPVGPSGTRSVSGAWPNWLVIPRGSRNPEAAFAYMEFLSVVGQAKWFKAIPEMPGSLKAVVAPPEELVQTRGEAFALDILAFFRGQSEVATPMWNSPVQGFANDQLTRMIEQVVNKVATPREALNEAQQACQGELDRVLRETAL